MLAGLLMMVAAMVLVRVGWGGQRVYGAIGWGLAVAALVLLAARDGAWGIAIGVVAGTATALAIVLHAGMLSPARALRPAREAPAISLPRRRGDLLRRLGVFALVVPAAFAAAQWLAFGAHAAARGAGAPEADATAIMLFLQPIAWMAIMAWQMTRDGPSRMILPPAAAALLGTILWGVA
ncbi:hypothetical protein [Sphingomonas radiodurans]|uniref:hypothetical protein n=1 Tax=Sphingomonas radiodurans TaxID=2890321 RepID=UPI001E2A0144|nr:hypothetical protein [Sphingomonas radiodurans]WBH18066.1 hypothetical protein LLW23_08240 [Sphingomonas radiodurans]